MDRRRLPVIPRWLALAGLVAILIVASAWVIGDQLGSSSKHPKRSSSATATFTQFKDPAGAFQGAYPSNWRRLPSSATGVVLLAAGPNGASYLVRKTQLTAPVSVANLSAVKKFTERVVRTAKHVIMIRQPEVVSLGGLPGYLYLYTFIDPTTGERGAHAFYFLFDGSTMITLVFQSLPSNNFESQAPVFDEIASKFQASTSAS